MTKTYMLTIPRWTHKRALYCMFDAFDTKRWIVGKETGKGGYEHWQVRVEMSNPEEVVLHKIDEKGKPKEVKSNAFFEWLKAHIPAAHVEESDTWCDYGAKEGKHFASWDTPEVLIERYGTLRNAQKRVVKAVRATTDREVVVWYDEAGNSGKSWLAGHLYETGQAHYIAPTLKSPNDIIKTAASAMMKQRRPMMVIDIPRSWKWSSELYTAIETIKDGLVTDPRYEAKTINIKGVKILVCTNTLPTLDALSADRWVILGRDGTPFS